MTKLYIARRIWIGHETINAGEIFTSLATAQAFLEQGIGALEWTQLWPTPGASWTFGPGEMWGQWVWRALFGDTEYVVNERELHE